MTTSRVVIGGGFAGLVTAWDALENSERVTVIDKSTALGGALAGVTLGGVTVDSGAEAFSTMSQRMVELVEELGLADRLETPTGASPVIATPEGNTAIPRGVMGIPADLEDLLASPALGAAEYDAAVAGDGAPLDAHWRDTSIATLVGERLGEPVLRTLVEPIVTAIYGPRALSCTVADLIPSFADAIESEGSLVAAARHVRGSSPGPGSAVATVRGGLHTLIGALAAQIRERGGEILLSTHASALARTTSGWNVITPGRTLSADAITVAGGPSTTRVLLGAFEPLRELTSSIQWQDTTITLVLVQDSSLDRAPLGSGALVASHWAGPIHATTHTNAKWAWINDALPSGSHILRCSLGSTPLGSTPLGSTSRGLSDTLSGAVDDGLRTLYGVDPRLIRERLTVRWSDNVFVVSPGHRERRAALSQVAGEMGIDIAGCLVSGNGLLGITNDTLGKERP